MYDQNFNNDHACIEIFIDITMHVRSRIIIDNIDIRVQ